MESSFAPPPIDGAWITRTEVGQLNVPDNPIVGFIEGDGVGADIWAASQPAFDAAVPKAWSGARQIQWWEIPAGEKSYRDYGEHLPEHRWPVSSGPWLLSKVL